MLEPRDLRRPTAATVALPVRTWWQHGDRRLRLDNLSAPVVVRVKVALALSVSASVLIFVLGLGLSPPGGAVRSDDWGSVSRLLIGFGFVAVATLQMLLVRVGLMSGRRVARAAMISSAVVTAAMGAGHVLAARDIERLHDTTTIFVRDAGGLFESVPYASANTALVGAAGYLMIVWALVVAVLPTRRPVSRRWDAREVFASMPGLVGLVVFLVADPVRVPVEQVIDAGWHESLQAGSGFALVSVVMSLAIAMSLVFLWQAIAAAGAARDVGVGLARLAPRLPQLLTALLSFKLAWVALGYAGVLPTYLGGGTDVWENSRTDGWLAWTIAAGLAALVAWMLTASFTSAAPLPRTAVRAQSLLAVGFLAPWLLAAFTALLALTFALLTPLADRLRGLSLWLADHGIWTGVITVFVAFVVGLIGLARSRSSEGRLLSIFLIGFGVWGGPRALAITVDRRDPSAAGSVELVTLDTAITVAIALLAAALWFRRRRGYDAALGADVPLLVLGASTFACYAGFLFAASPTTVKGIAFCVGLVFPAAYLLFANSQALNQDHPGRERLLLATVSLVATVLVLVAFEIGTGVLDERAKTFGDIGRVVFVIPVVSLMVISAIAHIQRSAERRITA
jgi:hypothetical protein